MDEAAVIGRIARLVAEETEHGRVDLRRATVAADVGGWDSLTHSRIMLRIEDEFGVRFDDGTMFGFADVGEIVDFLLDAHGSAPPVAFAAADAGTRSPGLAARQAPAEPDVGGWNAGAHTPPVFSLFSDARYPAPYSMFHQRPGAEPGEGADNNGFNNRVAPPMPKPAREQRVFMFGNSAVQDGALVGWINNRFAEEGRDDIVVYNFGITAGNCHQALMYLVWQGLDLEPDLVVTYDGYTDLAVPVGFEPRPGYPYNHYMTEIIHEYMGKARVGDLDFVREERRRRDLLRAACGWKTPEWEAQLVDSYVGTIAKFHQICGAWGIPMFSCLQSTLALKKTRVGVEIDQSPQSLNEHVARTYAATRRRLKAMEADVGSRDHRFADLSDLFAEDPEQCFGDMVHITQDRVPVVAGRLHDVMLQILAPQPARSKLRPAWLQTTLRSIVGGRSSPADPPT